MTEIDPVSKEQLAWRLESADTPKLAHLLLSARADNDPAMPARNSHLANNSAESIEKSQMTVINFFENNTQGN